MTNIKAGDRVTVAGHGPYEVAVTNVSGNSLLIRVPGDDPSQYGVREVESIWCEKAEEPWKPEPGSRWLDGEGNVWAVLPEGVLVSDDFKRTPTELLVDNDGTPLVELVRKPEVDVDRLCEVYLASDLLLVQWGAQTETDKEMLRHRLRAVVKELGL